MTEEEKRILKEYKESLELFFLAMHHPEQSKRDEAVAELIRLGLHKT